MKMWKTVFLAVSLTTGQISPAQEWMTNGLVAYYPLNGSAADASGNGNHGVLSNGVAPAVDLFGKSSSAYAFDGVNDLIALPTGLLNNCTQGTFVATIYLDSYSTNGRPIIEVGSEILTDFMVSVSSAGYLDSPWFTNTEPQFIRGAHQVPLHRWVQVALTWDGKYWKQYVGGKLDYQFESNVQPQPSTSSVKLGHHSHSELAIYFHGRMDDVRLYNRPLTLPEIEQLNLHANLTAYYPLNGNALDYSPHANHGVWHGAAAYSNGVAGGLAGQFLTAGSDYIEVAHQIQHVFNDGFTIGFWFKPNQLGTDGRILQKLYPVSNNQGNGWDIVLHADNQIRFYYASDPLVPFWSEAVCPIAVSTGSWHSVTYTYSASDNAFRGYLNGVLVATQVPTRSPLPMDTTLSLLMMHDRRDDFDAEGWLDEVRIYNRAVSDSEARQLYAVDSGRPYSTVGRAIRLDHQYLHIGTNYQLQVSHDLSTWANFGLPFTATAASQSQYVDAENTAVYFRLNAQ